MSKTDIICGDALEELKKMNNGSVHCIITSPPYNIDLGNNKYKKVGYNTYNDNIPYSDYLKWMRKIFSECFRVLSNDGRLCINIGDAKNGKITTHSDFIQICKEIGYSPMSTIIWNKNNTSNRCAWGSYLSSKAPSFPRPFEYVLIFCKTPKLERNGVSTITKEEWVEYTNGLWCFSPEKGQKKLGHPAMFPVELPYRLIKMLTYEGDIVMDPFMGIATTGIACLKTNRNFIGIEMDEQYCKIGQERINKFLETN
jgi:site-specific DNA-methyltransferase (adenine-specific)